MGKEGYYNTPNWNRGSIESKLKEKYQGFTYEFFVSKNLLPQLSELSIKGKHPVKCIRSIRT